MKIVKIKIVNLATTTGSFTIIPTPSKRLIAKISTIAPIFSVTKLTAPTTNSTPKLISTSFPSPNSSDSI